MPNLPHLSNAVARLLETLLKSHTVLARFLHLDPLLCCLRWKNMVLSLPPSTIHLWFMMHKRTHALSFTLYPCFSIRARDPTRSLASRIVIGVAFSRLISRGGDHQHRLDLGRTLLRSYYTSCASASFFPIIWAKKSFLYS
jgi:hypothetical protein